MFARWILLAAALLGCGANVVVEEDGEGGAGGAPGPGSGAGGPGSGASGPGSGAGDPGAGAGDPGTGGASPGGFEQACIQACDPISGCLADPDDCVDGCLASNPNCRAQQLDFLQCASVLVSDEACDMPNDCIDALADWMDCEAWCIDGAECGESSDGTCFCGVPTCGPTRYYEYTCYPGMPGSKCECYGDGELIGACFDNEATCSQDPSRSCCMTLFFIGGG